MIMSQNPDPQLNGTSEFPSPVQFWKTQRIREFNKKMGLEKSEVQRENKCHQQMTLLREQYDKAVAEHQSTAEKTREQIKNLENQISQAKQDVEQKASLARRLEQHFQTDRNELEEKLGQTNQNVQHLRTELDEARQSNRLLNEQVNKAQEREKQRDKQYQVS